MNYHTYKKQIKAIFVRTKKVSCPAFNHEEIIFNAKGINHLPRAIHLVKNATFWQEENKEERNGEIYRYFAFEAVVENRRIKVIIRQVGNGNKHFWSVIPAWRRDRFGVLNAKSRNLEK
ncbi:hypothetical protein A3A93_06635 [Candidatus Roizmanbacteria bacterium RIFCSPLOWO2_01_FULL_38_12]|uniref:Phage-Barnase-EndoU-ColicinE5/D-RelE like nuclease 2 domain-containing protein n=1 Tax=Candidatus Roizmanbacteria bacterium RIFCSPLOWO2_01_FULL_38_12 TaxID=1802061 RepID=A0A1F7IRY4_9BACT|nr:MAG: hypothetical protein A3A93_06635 [Candidatus Roizmanbacteria bacterium RIFCSPLOWO2_01_FULL_38_12]